MVVWENGWEKGWGGTERDSAKGGGVLEGMVMPLEWGRLLKVMVLFLSHGEVCLGRRDRVRSGHGPPVCRLNLQVFLGTSFLAGVEGGCSRRCY